MSDEKTKTTFKPSKKQALAFTVILGFIIGPAISLYVTPNIANHRFVMETDGDFDYIDMYVYTGDNETVEDLFVKINGFTGEILYSRYSDSNINPITLQVQVFVDGDKYIGYAFADRTVNTTVVIHNVTLSISYVVFYLTLDKHPDINLLIAFLSGVLAICLIYGGMTMLYKDNKGWDDDYY